MKMHDRKKMSMSDRKTFRCVRMCLTIGYFLVNTAGSLMLIIVGGSRSGSNL